MKMKKILNGLLLMITAITTSITSIILLVLLGGLAFIIFTCAMALDAAAAERFNLKQYGNCYVYDEVMDFPVETVYVFSCDQNQYRRIMFSVSQSGDYMVHVKHSDLKFVGDTESGRGLAEVTIQVDKNRQYESNQWEFQAVYQNTASLINQTSLVSGLLTEMQYGNRMKIHITDQLLHTGKQMQIELGGSVDAIKDFKQRIAHLNVIQ